MTAELNMINPTGSPYAKMYEAKFGTIIGRPMAFNPKADPNQRVFQDTMLKNNSIVRITPGIFHFNKENIERASVILDAHQKEVDEAMKGSPSGREQALNALNNKYQDTLIKEGIDMRYLSFKPDFPMFMRALQLLINRTSTSLFNRKLNAASGASKGFLTDITAVIGGLEQSNQHRGFNLWVEKATSVSESIDNSYTSSVFEGLQSRISRFTRELQAIGLTSGPATSAGTPVEVTTDSGLFSAQANALGQVVQKASAALSGSKIIIPQIWDDSKFNRSYNISFRFTSPYGDDRSVFVNVIMPFLFLLTCALPRQDGPSGMMNPFLLQMDAPGYFSTPMGCITSMSFVKGGSEQLWNSSGLPMVIEGTFAVSDLYNALALPLVNSHLLTNFGTAAFLNNLVGATLYHAEDPGLVDTASNWVKGGLLNFTDPLNAAEAKMLNIMRWAGVTGDSNSNSIFNSIMGQ